MVVDIIKDLLIIYKINLKICFKNKNIHAKKKFKISFNTYKRKFFFDISNLLNHQKIHCKNSCNIIYN